MHMPKLRINPFSHWLKVVSGAVALRISTIPGRFLFITTRINLGYPLHLLGIIPLSADVLSIFGVVASSLVLPSQWHLKMLPMQNQ